MPHYVCIHMQIPTSYYGFLFSESMQSDQSKNAQKMLPGQFATASLNIEGIEYDHHTRYYLVDDLITATMMLITYFHDTRYYYDDDDDDDDDDPVMILDLILMMMISESHYCILL